jgi:EAL domain-containing protein (putative c-di-GMP-specific phosphodiesterase class I)
VDKITECLSKYNVPASLVEIELTETALLKDTLTSRKVISALKELGCLLSLDDFGTGYSSIAHLRNYPISIVKIDKSLMPTSLEKSKNRSLVEGLVAMAKILGLDVIAEGIETQVHVDLCKSLNIRRVQGYFYSKPKNYDDITAAFINKTKHI